MPGTQPYDAYNQPTGSMQLGGGRTMDPSGNILDAQGNYDYEAMWAPDQRAFYASQGLTGDRATWDNWARTATEPIQWGSITTYPNAALAGRQRPGNPPRVGPTAFSGAWPTSTAEWQTSLQDPTFTSSVNQWLGTQTGPWASAAQAWLANPTDLLNPQDDQSHMSHPFGEAWHTMPRYTMSNGERVPFRPGIYHGRGGSGGGGGAPSGPGAESVATNPFGLAAYQQMMGGGIYGGVIPQAWRSTDMPGDVWGVLNSMGIENPQNMTPQQAMQQASSFGTSPFGTASRRG